MPQNRAAEIKEKALGLLARLGEIHAAGSGAIPMADLLKLFGTSTPRQVEADLSRRGDIELVFSGDGTGTFANSGPAFKTEFGPGDLVVPKEVGGTIRFTGSSAVLEFDQRRTMMGKALFLELKLQRVEVSEHHVAARLPGGLFDMEMQF